MNNQYTGIHVILPEQVSSLKKDLSKLLEKFPEHNTNKEHEELLEGILATVLGVYVVEPESPTPAALIAIEAICIGRKKFGPEYVEFRVKTTERIEQYADSVATARLDLLKKKILSIRGSEAWIDDRQTRELCQRIFGEIAAGNYNP